MSGVPAAPADPDSVTEGFAAGVAYGLSLAVGVAVLTARSAGDALADARRFHADAATVADLEHVVQVTGQVREAIEALVVEHADTAAVAELFGEIAAQAHQAGFLAAHAEAAAVRGDAVDSLRARTLNAVVAVLQPAADAGVVPLDVARAITRAITSTPG